MSSHLLRGCLLILLLVVLRSVSAQDRALTLCPCPYCPSYTVALTPQDDYCGKTGDVVDVTARVDQEYEGCFAGSAFTYANYQPTWEVVGIQASPQTGTSWRARFTCLTPGVGKVIFHIKAPRIIKSSHFSCRDEKTVERQLFILQVDIAMDGNRDEVIDFRNPADKQYLFWVNNDHDERTLLKTELTWVEDDLDGDPDCDNDYIGFKSWVGSSCKRDLEDFTRIHIRVDDTTASLPGITYHLKFENGIDNPSVNIFEAVGESSAYLSQVSVADDQIQNTRLLMVDSTERPLPNQYIKTGNQTSPFILEGKHKGAGDLTIIVKKDSNEICRKSVSLVLHDMPWFYDVYMVTATGERWESSVSQTASPRTPVAGYTPATDEKFLLVHGWNMTDAEKIQWAETTFKRLWWQGYQGSVAAFNWPTLADFDFWDIVKGGRHFDNSEFRAWLSADALVGVFNTLNSGGKLRVLAHSMGNVVTGEAIHKYSGYRIHTYLACQAALSGHYYDNTLRAILTSPDTPNIMGHFSNAVDNPAYLVGNAAKVTKRVNYMNEDDWALDLWESNNGLKSDNVTPYFFWYDGRTTQYEEGVDRFVRGVVGDIWSVYTVNTVRDLRITFSYIAESRSKALGQGPVAAGQFGNWNLKTEMLYDDEHYSHSKEFRSTVSEQWGFWKQVRKDCHFVPTYQSP